MRQVFNASKAFGLGSLNVGYVGENNVTEIAFDFSDWYEDYGEGSPVLRLKRFGDSAAYPVVLDIEDGHIAVWTVTNTDLQNKGTGKGQLQYMVDEAVKKSIVFDFTVANALESTDEVPDPYEDWMDDLIRLTAESETNAFNAQESAEAAAESEANARTSELNAATAENNASGYATQAQTYANNASGSASQASGYANTALGYANDASGYVASASGYAEEAGRQAGLAEGYAESISDKVGDLTDLDTAAKTNIVSAVNEVVGVIGDVESLLSAI